MEKNISNADLLELGARVHKRLEYNSSVCNYGIGFGDGTTYTVMVRYCHAWLQNYDARKPPAVITNKIQLKRPGCIDKEGMEKYYNYLFNDSPFAECYVTKTLSDALNKGITLRTTPPANLVCAAAIATRQAWEYPDVATSLNNMIGFGIEPRKAHIAAHLITVDSEGGFSSSRRAHHVAVSSCYFSKESIKNFLSGTLPKKDKYNINPYRKVRSYRDIGIMWGERGILSIDGGDDNIYNSLNSNPFGLIVGLGRLKNKRMDVVEAVERALSP